MKIICDCKNEMEDTGKFNEQGSEIWNCSNCGKQKLVSNPLPGLYYEL